jgi:3'-phosphoadenosine 5'-phosphosulfate sulfotransferase (PAPS reductase)/FAD synthetase
MTEDYKYAHLRGDPDDPLKKFDKKAREEFNKQSLEKKAKSLASKTFILYPFELYYNQDKSFEEKEQDSLELIENHLKIYKKPYIATSFGSDSMVLMHLVMRAAKNVGVEYPDMFLNDTLNTFKEEKQYWADMIKLWGIADKVKILKPPTDERGNMMTVWSIAKKVGHLPSFRSTRKSSKDHTSGSKGNTPECCDILKKATMKKYLKSLPKEERYDLQFVGTRAQESHMRAISVMQRCRTSILKTFVNYPMRAVTPLSFWTMEDTQEYYKRYDIPKNPAYKAHDMERMGCASCPAHKWWEIRLAKDPTNEGFGMLKQNFKILKQTIADGTENPDRLQESVNVLKRYLKKKESKTLTGPQRERIEKLIQEYDVVDPDIFCNPVEMLDEAEKGLKQWVDEENHEQSL